MKLYKVCGFLAIILNVCMLESSSGCMSRVRRQFGFNRGDDRLPDYRQLHSVDCACPCDSHQQLEKYGRCSRCLHFRRPLEFT